MQWSPSIFINAVCKNQSSCIITFTYLVTASEYTNLLPFSKPHFILKNHCFQEEFLNNKSILFYLNREKKVFIMSETELTFWKGCHWLYRSLHNRHFLRLLKSAGKTAIKTGLYSEQQCPFFCRKYLLADKTILGQGINPLEWNPRESFFQKELWSFPQTLLCQQCKKASSKHGNAAINSFRTQNMGSRRKKGTLSRFCC